MRFQKGVSGNPSGRPAGRRRWISDRERFIEAQKSFQSLKRIRDGEVLERKVIGKNENGEPITADIVASIRDLIVCNDKILNRVLGLPRIEGDTQNSIDPARIFLDTLEALLRYLAVRDPAALEHLEIHIRKFCEQARSGGLLSGEQPTTAIARREFPGIVVDKENGHL